MARSSALVFSLPPNGVLAMRKLVFVLFFFLVIAARAAYAERPVLTVYTYDAFTSSWSAGPKIKAAFEAQCDCELNYVAVDGSTGILSRVLLEGAGSRADVVLGLDNNLIIDAQKTGLLSPHNVDLGALDLPFEWRDPTFLPFDYGYFAFIYDRDKLPEPPTSLRQLVEADDSLKILIQDPRSSTPGVGLLLWVKSVYGDSAFDAWRKLAGKIVTVTKGWTEAYSLFLAGEADMVLSYTTSPAYHITVEGRHQYQAAAFSEGHGVQIEVAAQLKNARNPVLAQQFMDFIITADFQSFIPTGHWMYPVIDLDGGLPAAYDTLVKPAANLLMNPQRVAKNKSAWVDEFSQALNPASDWRVWEAVKGFFAKWVGTGNDAPSQPSQ